ncbi:MAG: LytTR family transcriptional regulator DNA-binding domain-containing protein [Bacteroidota bacterium]
MKLVPLFTIVLSLLVFNSIAQTNPSDTNVVDMKGMRQGKWKKYENKILKYEGQFKDNKPYGEFRYYYPDKKLQTLAVYSNNGDISRTITYYPEGKKMSTGMYWKQKKDSIWSYFNDSDTLVAEENYIKGVKNGQWKTYYPSGKLLQILNYKSDDKEGEWIEYYANEAIKSKSIYKNNVLNGLFKHFYSSGKTMISGTYVNGKKDGVWMYFKENGLNKRMEKYSNNKLIEEKIFVSNGNNKNYPVAVDSIAYFYSKEGSIIMINKNAVKTTIDNSLDEMEEILGTQKFFRINENMIIKLDAIQSTENYTAKQMKVNLKPTCEIEAIVDEEKSAVIRSWNYK